MNSFDISFAGHATLIKSHYKIKLIIQFFYNNCSVIRQRTCTPERKSQYICCFKFAVKEFYINRLLNIYLFLNNQIWIHQIKNKSLFCFLSSECLLLSFMSFILFFFVFLIRYFLCRSIMHKIFSFHCWVKIWFFSHPYYDAWNCT